MEAKQIIRIAIGINLIFGNLIISLTIGLNEPLIGKIIAHFTFSTIAILLIVRLIRISHKKKSVIYIIVLSLIFSFLVPVISTLLISAGFAIYKNEFDSIFIGVPISLITGVVSWPFWLPFGIINSFFFVCYSRKLTSESSGNNDQEF